MDRIGFGQEQHQMAVPEAKLTRIQRQALERQQSFAQWQMDPLSQLPDSQVITTVGLSNTGADTSFGDFWMNRARRDILELPEGSPVTVSVTSNGSGAGKGRFLQGVLELILKDQYLREEAANRGFSVVPVTIPFAMYAKAAQLPPARGGFSLIDRDGAGHGRFEDAEYARITGFGRDLHSGHARIRHKGIRYVYLLEATGTPWVVEKNNELEVYGMSDRGNSLVYGANKSNPEGRNYFFLLQGDRDVKNQSIESRGMYDFDTQENLERIFKRGRDRFLLVNEAGKTRDVATMGVNIQRSVIELLRLASAPPAAILKTAEQYNRLKIELADANVIPDSSDEVYLESLKRQLTNPELSHAYSEPDVMIMRNPWRFNELNDFNLEYLLRYCLVSRLFPKLIPARLRGTYMN